MADFPTLKGPKRENRFILWLKKTKTTKRFGFLIYSYFKDIAFTAVKRDGKFLTRYMKGVPVLSKMVYERVRGWTTQRSKEIIRKVRPFFFKKPYK